MKTLEELNRKTWYPPLKVLYMILYLPYFLLLFIVVIGPGRDLHTPILPDNVEVLLKDPEFYKLNDDEMIRVINTVTKSTALSDGLSDNKINQIMQELGNRPVPTAPLKKKYRYNYYYTFNIINCIYYCVPLTFCYFLVMELIRRSFYYAVMGSVFPKE